MRLYVIRHGETKWNKEGRLQGAVDIPLNAYGEELAEKTREGLQAEQIQFDRVYVSPLIRAQKTAEILLKEQDIGYEPDARIEEMHFGEYEGVVISELKNDPQYEQFSKLFTDPMHFVADRQAESFEELHARVERFLKEKVFVHAAEDKNILLVCHGAVSRAILCVLHGWGLDRFWGIDQFNCCVNEIRFGSDFSGEREEGGAYKGLQFVCTNKLYYEKKDQLSATDRLVRKE